jgi:hypothetical protein
MKFYLVSGNCLPIKFKSVTTWLKGDPIAESYARFQWAKALEWFIDYRNAFAPTEHAFLHVETFEVQVKRADLIKPAGGRLEQKFTYRLNCYVYINSQELAEAFKSEWWNGAISDERIFEI